MFGFLRRLFGQEAVRPEQPARFTMADLASRLRVDAGALQALQISYTSFEIPKRSGGKRTISVPAAPLKQVQRLILRRLLGRLRAHPCATGFERGHSIVTNALPHAGKNVVIRLDLQNFFPSITAPRVEKYFGFIGYDREAAGLLTRLCTYEGALPQGAPTSPRLSNLVNYRLDARLAALAECSGMSYSRYADDMTFSARTSDVITAQRVNPRGFGIPAQGNPRVNDIIHIVKDIIRDEGYRLHTQKKLRISRGHDRQLVTGLVVNARPNLPRATRRRLRAIEHHLRTGRSATLTPAQMAGWKALQHMIARQSTPAVGS
jgi:retron-type reverse transcriptase